MRVRAYVCFFYGTEAKVSVKCLRQTSRAVKHLNQLYNLKWGYNIFIVCLPIVIMQEEYRPNNP